MLPMYLYKEETIKPVRTTLIFLSKPIKSTLFHVNKGGIHDC